ncbi:response regulator [Sphaerotilaceae bacterium SBD11-9]
MEANILVVDDNALNRKLVCDLLEMEGFSVTPCVDAEDALAKLAHSAVPDLILMDIALPGMDGLTLTRQLRSDARYAQMPIVALTAFAMKGDKQKALDAGCSGYIAKPIDTRRLPNQVRDYLAESRVTDSGLRIMIVEDHRIDLKLAGESARLSGHVVLSNTTAEQAIASLDQGHPDVVLLDLNLPGMDGLAFVRRIKTDPQTRHLPVVAVTAYPDKYLREELLAAGCASYLVKPIDMQLLLRELEKASSASADPHD